jgi:hypothetical protein
MKAIYTVLHGKVYKVKQDTSIPTTLTQKTPGVSATVNTDSATKAVTQFVNINTLETTARKTNKELYEEMVAMLKKCKVTNIKTIQNFFKIYMDYTVYEGNKEIEHSAVIKPITAEDMLFPLGVATNSECVYRRVKTFTPSVEFRLRSQMPMGIMSTKREKYTFKFNNVCIFQDFTMQETHNSIYETPYSIGSDTLNHGLENMVMIYSSSNEGLEIQPVRLDFSPRSMTVKFDITLCNFIVAYNDQDINKILLDNINEKYCPDKEEDIYIPPTQEDEGTLFPEPENKPESDGIYNPDHNGFYGYYQRCRETTPNGLLVVEDLIPDNVYDVNTMIKQEMVTKDIPDIEIGEYVLYVNAFNIDKL